MRHFSPSRSAGMALALSCLFASTTLMATARQANAQASAAVPVRPAPVPSSGVVTLADHTPMQVLDGRATRVDRYPAENKLRLVLAIRPPHMAEEEKLIREQQTKGSPNFHKFLTPEEWNARFAPSEADEQKVVDWAESVGLTVTKRYNHRLIVNLEGPVGTIEKAFGVTINHYQLRGETLFSNDRDPMIPAHLAGLVYNVQGLNSIQHDHGSSPNSLTENGPDYQPGPVVAKHGEDHADGDPTKLPKNMAAAELPKPLISHGEMDPTDLYSSQTYNYDGLAPLSKCCNPHHDSGGTPNVSNIAIAGFGNYLGSDIAGFHSTYPYLAYLYNVYDINGTPGCATNSISPPCATGETTEDMEYTIATANSFGSSNDTAHIYVYLGGDFSNGTFTTIYSDMLSDNTARVMSTSWSCTEVFDCSDSTMDSRHSIFNSMVGQGWTLVAASGDRGASDDCQNNIPSSGPKIDPSAHTSVAYPASDYDVVAAGGTQLDLYANGTWDYEHAWQGGFGAGSCNGNGGGSGGGVSTYYAQQSYQSALSSFGSKRLTPDISLNALGLGQNMYINGAVQGSANGTSVVAPEMAGFFAQENSYLNIIGHICGDGTASCTPVGNPLWEIYDDALGAAPEHDPFYNMLSGCNDNDATQADGLSYFCAGPGYNYDSSNGPQYNLVSGWGSVNMMQLAWAINWQLIPAYGSPSLSFTGPGTFAWYNTDQIIGWTLNDADSANAHPAPGDAGFTQGWDTIPPDSFSEPHGGAGDSFYSGPEFPYASSGCLSFNGASGCSGGPGQGCHTAVVRGWDNQGNTTYGTYGPVCYDTVAPSVAVGTSPATSYSQWTNQSVSVTLTPSDPGGSNASGIYRTYFGINTGACAPPNNLGACGVYSQPIVFSGQQQSYMYYFTEDRAGNFSPWLYQYISIDLTPPTTTVGLSGTAYNGGYDTAVQVTLNAGDTGGSGLAATHFVLDGGPLGTYSSPFLIGTPGSHFLQYWSVDGAGNVESTHSVTFTIYSVTGTTIASSSNPSTVGQSVKLTATVSPSLGGTATGSVIFYNGATNLGTATLSGNTAYIYTTALPAGSLTLQAAYQGSGYYIASNSFPLDQTVYQPAVLTAPAAASTLPGPAATFTWSAPSGVQAYQLWVGSTGVGSANLLSSGVLHTNSTTRTGLPTNGEQIYVRLFSEFNGTWVREDYVVTAASQAALTSPAQGGTLPGPTATFTWSAYTGSSGGAYQLWIGDQGVGSNNLLSSGVTHVLSTTRTNMPTNGEMLYARLYTDYAGTWVHADYTFYAATAAVMQLPTPGAVLPGSTDTFVWSVAPGASDYELWIGTTGVGSANIYSGGPTTATTATSNKLPTNGGTVYVRLYTLLGGVWVHADYQYAAFSAADRGPTPVQPAAQAASEQNRHAGRDAEGSAVPDSDHREE